MAPEFVQMAGTITALYMGLLLFYITQVDIQHLLRVIEARDLYTVLVEGVEVITLLAVHLITELHIALLMLVVI
jgi:hypothetical protein